MKNKKILLTGATKGLGKLLAREFHKDNFDVIGTDLYKKEEVSQEALDNLTSYYQYDLSNNKDIGEFVKKLFTDHPNIEIIVNNAGILDFRFFDEYTDEEVLKTISVNLVASILIVKNCYPYFKERGNGKIINISSSSSFRGFETGCTYTPTKTGLNLFTESFKKELAILKKKKGIDITINNVCPGRIATEEYLAKNPQINPNTLISHKTVYQKIRNLITSDKNGEIIPIFPGKLKREIFKKEIKRFLF